MYLMNSVDSVDHTASLSLVILLTLLLLFLPVHSCINMQIPQTSSQLVI